MNSHLIPADKGQRMDVIPEPPHIESILRIGAMDSHLIPADKKQRIDVIPEPQTLRVVRMMVS